MPLLFSVDLSGSLPRADVDANGSLDADISAGGSLKGRGKGKFKMPSFNKKDKKPKISLKGPGKIAL